MENEQPGLGERAFHTFLCKYLRIVYTRNRKVGLRSRVTRGGGSLDLKAARPWGMSQLFLTRLPGESFNIYNMRETKSIKFLDNFWLGW